MYNKLHFAFLIDSSNILNHLETLFQKTEFIFMINYNNWVFILLSNKLEYKYLIILFINKRYQKLNKINKRFNFLMLFGNGTFSIVISNSASIQFLFKY
ncbi:hypothetical protein BpHYR1_005723 [Brachionus plicatilis]|uniref:Uncharacterized protein n=1 Tax=Brachionus plicatilis TaxID=10195 RepID=A0A3M7S230_BRAPC|nr:hypothetical protein BpHYR1_005723 [Brachionus plicatilis]